MRDRFELMSAYLDGEVTAAERRQVEQWLETDPKVQQLYQRLLKLRQGMRNLSIPATQHATEQTVQQVMTRLERQPRRRFAWGGAAVAAMFLAAMSPVLFRSLEVPVQQALRPDTGPELSNPASVSSPSAPATVAEAGTSDTGLMISLASPVIDIPEVAASTEVPLNKNFDQLNDTIR